MGAGGGGMRQSQFKKNDKVFPRKLLIKKNICQKKEKKRFPLYMYTVCHASRTMTDMSKLIPHTNKHSLVASQVPDSSPTVGTLSIRCTNLSWPKRLLLHYLLDFVGCFAFVDADNRNAMSTRRLMPKLDELYCFSAVPELINNNLLTVCRR